MFVRQYPTSSSEPLAVAFLIVTLRIMISFPNETTIAPQATRPVPMERDTLRQESMRTKGSVRAFQGDHMAMHNRKSRRTQRLVRFALSPPVFIDAAAHEADRIWWQKSELNAILHSAKTGSKEFGRRGLLMEGLDRAYNRARRIATAVDDEDRLSGRLREIHVNDALIQWSRYGHSRRGLEKWCSNAHHRTRLEATRRQRAAVAGYDGDDMVELASNAQAFSRTARIFARLIGEADAIAISNVIPSEKSVCALGIASRRFSLPTGVGDKRTNNDVLPCSVPTILRSPSAKGTILSSAPPAPQSTPITFRVETMSPRKVKESTMDVQRTTTDSPRGWEVMASSPKCVMLPEFGDFMKKIDLSLSP